jgi:uncharacterized protein (DUF305 family)
MTNRMKILGVVIGVVLLGFGVLAGSLISRNTVPGEDSADVGFARDMSEHHSQAVEMGMIAFHKATVSEIRTLGGDIALTQQAQFGMMQTWLKTWGYSPNASAKPMAWMPEGQQALNGNLMPGMASREEINKLRDATGKDVDILFCQYMLRHHLGGVHMVNGVLEKGRDPQVIALATTMKANQSAEVKLLTQLLTQLGAEPLS